MSPTIVLRDGTPWLALGSPGGSTIITTVLQMLLNRIDLGMTLPEAIAAPRAAQRNTADVTAEQSFIDAYGDALGEYGHTFVPAGDPGTSAGRDRGGRGDQAQPGGRLLAAAEPGASRRGCGRRVVAAGAVSTVTPGLCPRRQRDVVGPLRAGAPAGRGRPGPTDLEPWFAGVLRDGFVLTLLGRRPVFRDLAADGLRARLAARSLPPTAPTSTSTGGHVRAGRVRRAPTCTPTWHPGCVPCTRRACGCCR